MFFQQLGHVLISSDLWAATLQFAALLLLPALGGVISERSGVTNIAMEGMMLTGAYAGVMTALATHSVFGGVLGAIIAGCLISLVHAVVSINFKANQIVSGIAINIAALGLTNYLLFIQTGNQGIPSLKNNLRLPNVSLGTLSNIPFIGPVFFQQNIIFYVAVTYSACYPIFAFPHQYRPTYSCGRRASIGRRYCWRQCAPGALSLCAREWRSFGTGRSVSFIRHRWYLQSRYDRWRRLYCPCRDDFRQVYTLGGCWSLHHLRSG